jgi:hypothetical protein
MLIPGAVCHTATSLSGSGYGSGLSSTPFTTLKIAVFAPIPIARVRIVTIVKEGDRPRRRRIWLT